MQRRIRAGECLVIGVGSVLGLETGPIHLWYLVEQLQVMLAVPSFVEFELAVYRVLFNERQNRDSPTQTRLAVLVTDVGRKIAEACLIIDGRENDLLQVVHALTPLAG